MKTTKTKTGIEVPVLLHDALQGRPTIQPLVTDNHVRRIRPGVAFCSVCNREFESSGVAFRDHIKGKKHQAALAKPKTPETVRSSRI